MSVNLSGAFLKMFDEDEKSECLIGTKCDTLSGGRYTAKISSGGIISIYVSVSLSGAFLKMLDKDEKSECLIATKCASLSEGRYSKN